VTELETRRAIAVIIETTLTRPEAVPYDVPRVHTSALEIRTEIDAVAAFGTGETDVEGKRILRGWVVPPGKRTTVWLSAGGRFKTRGFAYTIFGYRSRVPGEEHLSEDDIDVLSDAIVDGLAVDDETTPVAADVHPALLAGLPVWETQINLTIVAHGG
jgi:hypothetical protein